MRLAIANIHRPGALTPTIVLSLGLGLALLVTVIEIDGNLRRQFMAALPDKAPSFYFVDIQSADAERFDAFVRERAPQAKLERVPMLRGRIVAANGVKAEDLKAPPSAAWVLQSDRGITYAGELPAGSRLVEGQWWGADYAGPAAGLVREEDRRRPRAQGRRSDHRQRARPQHHRQGRQPAQRRLAEPRHQFRAGLLARRVRRRAAHPYRDADLSGRRRHAASRKPRCSRRSPMRFRPVTTVRVKDALDAVGGIVRNLVLAVRGASVVALVAAVLVLGGALAAGHRHRVYDAVVLKTLGATRGRLIGAYALEYLLLGAATALFGVAAGSIAAWLVVTELMNLPFVWLPGPAAAAAFGALAVTIAFGLIGTFSALGHKPAPVLRNL